MGKLAVTNKETVGSYYGVCPVEKVFSQYLLRSWVTLTEDPFGLFLVQFFVCGYKWMCEMKLLVQG